MTATPHQLVWESGDGRIELAYENADTVRVRGRGLDLKLVAADPVLTPFSGPYFYQEPADGSYVFTLYQTGRRYRITVLRGRADPLGIQPLGSSERGVTMTGEWEIAIEEYETARAPYPEVDTFEQVVKAARAEFDAFVDGGRSLARRRHPGRRTRGLRVVVGDRTTAGFVTRPAVLMSKHWMDKVWSWDHCFNAIALGDGHPDLAVGPVPAPLRPSGRRGGAPRLDHAFRDPVQLRQTPDPRLGSRPAGTSARSPPRAGETYRPWSGGPTTGLPPAASPGTNCPTTSTATTADGTTPRPSTRSVSSRPRPGRLPRPPAARTGRARPELGPASRPAGRRARRHAGTPS